MQTKHWADIKRLEEGIFKSEPVTKMDDIELCCVFACIRCNRTIQSKTGKFLECFNKCGKGLHLQCSVYQPSEIKVLENKNVKWICDTCEWAARKRRKISKIPMSTVKETVNKNKCDFLQTVHPEKPKKSSNEIDSPNIVVKYFLEYCEFSSIHGIKYFGEKRTLFEKIFWICIYSISLCTCAYFLVNVYNSPVIISLANNPKQIWEIPFPAITICPEVKTDANKYNFTDLYKKFENSNSIISSEERNNFDKISLLCENNRHSNNTIFNDDPVDFLYKVSRNIEFQECYWKKSTSCTNSFSEVITEEGVCYAFNMLDRDDIYVNSSMLYKSNNWKRVKRSKWTLEDGFSAKMPNDEEYPKRAISPGAKGGLYLDFLALDRDIDYLCRWGMQGFRVAIHRPDEIPRMSMQYFRIPLNRENIVVVKPDMITTAESLKANFDVKKTNCYFNSKRKLKYFKHYTQNNCEIECQSNFTLEACGCVAFYMPRDADYPICGPGSFPCLHEAEDDLVLREANFSRNDRCSCLPNCLSLSYDFEMSYDDLNYQQHLRILNITGSKGQWTALHIYFKELQFLHLERQDMSSFYDFIANCGGLLGLFIGFSLMSFVEILYFLSLRLLCNLRLRRKHNWTRSLNERP